MCWQRFLRWRPGGRRFSGATGVVRETLLETIWTPGSPDRVTKRSPFRYFRTSPEIIRLPVMLSIRFPLSLRNVEDLLHERGI